MADNFEILAPAGDFDNLKAAVFSGANAVYLGVQSFNARASAANFDYEQLKQAVEFCHGRNVKVNVTLNTILYDSELESFAAAVKEIAKCGVDAVILQDLAAAEIVKRIAPDLPRHGSTQMAVHSLEGALLLKKMGYTRVILARELSFEKIKYITENCGIETEVFVHGALCVCLSGQCYASTFLGGRSGNRGRCAGTCRLPFSARSQNEDYHLSLKDLCAVDFIPKLMEAGVKCVKIEGRLRTPEYVAAAVDACVKAKNKMYFDKQLLSDAFSRSGFTNNYMENKFSADIFGVRTKEDAQRTKDVLPSLRQLYRREGQYVPVDFSFKMGQDKSLLTISDGSLSFDCEISQPVQDSNGDFKKSLENSLAKLGGTPFYLRNADIEILDGKYIPLSSVNEARKELAQTLLRARSKGIQYQINDVYFEENEVRKKVNKLIASFENVCQIPSEYVDKFEYIFLPVEQADKMNGVDFKQKTVLTLPRDLFSSDDKLKQQIAYAKQNGFNKFCVQNIGHIPLVEGCEIFSSFTLNVSNSLSASEYKKLGVQYITLSPEITLESIKRITDEVKTIVYAYGYIPLMLTKSCPLSNVRDCGKCSQKGYLTDRKGAKMTVICHGKASGYRLIYNSVPLYMGDKQNEIYADYLSLNFTFETENQIKDIIRKFINGLPIEKDFTRGLYYKGSI